MGMHQTYKKNSLSNTIVLDTEMFYSLWNCFLKKQSQKHSAVYHLSLRGFNKYQVTRIAYLSNIIVCLFIFGHNKGSVYPFLCAIAWMPFINPFLSLTVSTITLSGVLPENTKPRFRAALTRAPSSWKKKPKVLKTHTQLHEESCSYLKSNTKSS